MAIETAGGGAPVDKGGTTQVGNGVSAELPNAGQVSAGEATEGAPYAVVGGREFATHEELTKWYDAGQPAEGADTGGGADTKTDTAAGADGKDTLDGGKGNDALEAPAAKTDDEIKASLKEAGGIYADPRYEPAAIEFEKTGTLSPETIKATAESFGVPETFVQEFIKNAKDAREANSKLAEATKGQPSAAAIEMGKVALEVIPDEADYTAMMAWGKDNISKEQQASYNRALDAGDAPAVKAFLQSFQTAFQASGQAQPPRDVTQEGGAAQVAGPAGGGSYASQAEMEKDMNDPRYKNDRAFIKMVEGKVARSNF